MAFAVRGRSLLLAKNVFLIVLELSLAKFTRVLQGFFGFIDAAQPEQILTEQVIGSADLPHDILLGLREMNVLLESIDCLLDAIRFRIGFTEIKIRRSFVGAKASCILKRDLRRREVPQCDGSDPQKHLKIILFGIYLEFFFELFASLRISLFAQVFQVRVSA